VPDSVRDNHPSGSLLVDPDGNVALEASRAFAMQEAVGSSPIIRFFSEIEHPCKT
jgi:hypothetical protein